VRTNRRSRSREKSIAIVGKCSPLDSQMISLSPQLATSKGRVDRGLQSSTVSTHYVQQDVRILRGHGIAVSNWCSGG